MQIHVRIKKNHVRSPRVCAPSRERIPLPLINVVSNDPNVPRMLTDHVAGSPVRIIRATVVDQYHFVWTTKLIERRDNFAKVVSYYTRFIERRHYNTYETIGAYGRGLGGRYYRRSRGFTHEFISKGDWKHRGVLMHRDPRIFLPEVGASLHTFSKIIGGRERGHSCLASCLGCHAIGASRFSYGPTVPRSNFATMS